MSTRFLSVLVFAVLSFSACDHAHASPGALQTFSSACDKSNEGQQIAVEGYLRLPDTLKNSSSVDLHLYPDLTFSGKPIGVPMKFGDGPDEAKKITSSFHDADLQVRLADGIVVPFGTRVRVSGKMYHPILPQDFDCGLENPYVELAK